VPRSERITVTCAAQAWEVRNPNAYRWVTAVLYDPDGLTGVFPGLLPDRDTVPMFETMKVFEDIERRWTNTARVVLTRASGREWWRALNLIQAVAKHWTGINGGLLLSGIDAKRLDLPSYLDAAYVHMMRSFSDEERLKLEFDLNRIPLNAPVRQDRSQLKKSMAAFAAD
jgi:hypothetical protein